MSSSRGTWRRWLAASTFLVTAATALADDATFDIPVEDATAAIPEFGRQARVQIIAPTEQLIGVRTAAVKGQFSTRQALDLLLAGTNLIVASDDGKIVTLHAAPKPVVIPAVQPAPAPVEQLEEITVTAQRRTEDLQSVLLAISAYSERMIDTQQISSIVDIGNLTPGLEITPTGGGDFTNATIRGVGVVAEYLDGVYLPNNVRYTYSNIASVEVDKGPQGTLFGRNSAGGVVSIMTKNPTQDPHEDVTASYGLYGKTEESLYVSSGIAPDLAADLSLLFEDQPDGWGRNLLTGKDTFTSEEWSGRTKWVYTPSDTTKLTLIAYGDRNTQEIGATTILVPGTIATGGLQHQGGFYDSYTDFPGYGEATLDGTSLRTERQFDWATLINLIAWNSIATNSAAGGGEILKYQGLFSAVNEIYDSEELQLQSPAGSRLTWVGGLYMFRDYTVTHGRSYGIAAAGQPGDQFLTDNTLNTQSYAVFGQLTVPLSPDTHVTLGLRYTVDKESFFNEDYTIHGRIYNNFGEHAQWEKPTPKLALDHAFAGNLLGYVSWSRGYQSGLFNMGAADQAHVAPEVLDDFEAGAKSDLLDHRLRVNGALFYEIMHDLQISQFQGLGLPPFVTNAGAAAYRGIDLDVTAVPLEHLTAQLGLEYLDAVYTRFGTGIFDTPRQGGGFSPYTADATDNEVPFAPHFAASFNAQYLIPTSVGDILLVGNLTYHDGMTYDVQNLLHQPPYFILDGSATWTSVDGAWDCKLYGKNLTNTRLIQEEAIAVNAEFYSPSPPLEAGIRVGYHF